MRQQDMGVRRIRCRHFVQDVAVERGEGQEPFAGEFGREIAGAHFGLDAFDVITHGRLFAYGACASRNETRYIGGRRLRLRLSRQEL